MAARRRKARTVSETVATHIEALERESQLDTHGSALAAVARNLAGLLDLGEPVMMTGTWARELRNTLDAMRPEAVADDGDDWTADLSAEVRDGTDRP